MQKLSYKGSSSIKVRRCEGSRHFNIPGRQTGCNSLWVRSEETVWWLISFAQVFKRKVSWTVIRRGSPAGEERDPQVWIPFPFKAALTIHLYLTSPGRKSKFPVGSGREGNTTGSGVALGHAPLPSNPRWWPEWKQLGMYYLTEASIQQQGGSPNHCWSGLGTQARTDQRG